VNLEGVIRLVDLKACFSNFPWGLEKQIKNTPLPFKGKKGKEE